MKIEKRQKEQEKLKQEQEEKLKPKPKPKPEKKYQLSFDEMKAYYKYKRPQEDQAAYEKLLQSQLVNAGQTKETCGFTLELEEGGITWLYQYRFAKHLMKELIILLNKKHKGL